MQRNCNKNRANRQREWYSKERGRWGHPDQSSSGRSTTATDTRVQDWVNVGACPRSNVAEDKCDAGWAECVVRARR